MSDVRDHVRTVAYLERAYLENEALADLRVEEFIIG
jgi:hypothetical protein